jgi:hypothetical protein
VAIGFVSKRFICLRHDVRSGIPQTALRAMHKVLDLGREVVAGVSRFWSLRATRNAAHERDRRDA